MSTKIPPDKAPEATEAKGSNSLYKILIPADPAVWAEARRLSSDRSVRVEDLSLITLQDPIIVIELLRTANALYFAGGKSPITSTKTAIMRLGSDVVVEVLEKMKERPPIEDEEVHRWLEVHRVRCKRASILARMLSEILARTLSDECQSAGLLMYVGEMLATIHLHDIYADLARDNQRTSVNYRLAQDHRFDVEKMGISYLRRNGIPEALLFAIDRDGRPRTPDRTIMKPICSAAGELLEAFDHNRWEKMAPGKTLPPKSSLRLLQISEQQYLKVYERASEYLFADRLLEEKKQSTDPADTGPASGSMITPEQNDLQQEIESILTSSESARATTPAPGSSVRPSTTLAETSTALNRPAGPASTAEEFSLKSTPQHKPVREQKAKAIVTPPPMATPKANAALSDISGMFEKAQSSEELLSKLLQMLIDKGMFKKSALVVVSKDRQKAIVVAARGPNIGNGQTLILDDPLHPLAQCFSKVQSFGNKESKYSPFGSKSFAVAPIEADHDTPVALYADCGNEASISFEARRVFRNVIEILNQKLPQIPGGIPVELSSLE